MLGYHNNNANTGVNVNETILTPANVNVNTFGKLFTSHVDGQIYSQPLYVSNVMITTGTHPGMHNVVYVATQHDSLYAFDADASPCVQLWQVSMVDTAHGAASGETSVPYTSLGNASGDVKPEVGVTSTPVIDPSTQTMYLVSLVKDSGGARQFLHAVDLATGAEKLGGPVEI